MRFFPGVGPLVYGLAVFLLLPAPGGRAQGSSMSLSGAWEIRADREDRGLREGWFRPGTGGDWRGAVVPSAWESSLGIDFDGVAWYRKGFRVPPGLEGRRVFLRFQGAATLARVWVNGKEMGSHTGAWTPWEVEITSALLKGGIQVVVVRLDEKVGYNTQGFLPVVAPHFGGLWQGVEILFRGAAWIEKDRIFLDASGRDEKGRRILRVRLPLGGDPPAGARVTFSWPEETGPDFGVARVPVKGRTVEWVWRGSPLPWTPGGRGKARLYRLGIALLDGKGRVLDRVEEMVGFRKVEARGAELLLNGRPFLVRGILNWGYYPPLLAPRPDPELFRKEIRMLRSMGFNLVKFCLWEPPSYLLDITDEEGMAAWVEYPTWHPRIDRAHREELLRDYRAMSDLDGNHPSVILRSVTCETGPSADLGILKELYTLLKERCPGTLVEDDSSWIGWNRIHDFWDDHTYWNNNTWRKKLRSLDEFRRKRRLLPLVLGEAIAADTWADTGRMLPSFAGGIPFWAPKCLESQLRFEKELQERYGAPGFDPVADLLAWSRRYALEMRRFQVEAFRQELPRAGYVISVIRDIPACRMGILDALGRPKWKTGEWDWHGPISLSIRTVGDRRTINGLKGKVWEGNLDFEGRLRREAPGEKLLVHFRLGGPGGREKIWVVSPDQVRWNGPPFTFSCRKKGDRPEKVLLEGWVEAPGKGCVARGEWIFWTLPSPRRLLDSAFYGEGVEEIAGASNAFCSMPPLKKGKAIPKYVKLVVARALDEKVLDYLEGGGRVLLLASDRRGSFRVEPIWFLRGTAWAPPEPKGFFERFPREMLAYLQLFDLQGKGVIRGERLWGEVDPLLAFFETHDLDRVRPDLLLFQTRVGKGRLLVSALAPRLSGIFGRWLLEGPAPERGLGKETIQALRQALSGEILKVRGAWLFRKDPEGKGLEMGWEKAGIDPEGWISLRARSGEEGKIWGAYDGWGWYRKEIEIPERWKGKKVRLVFDSVDDMYELYVNGKRAGGYGKPDRSESSYLKRTWVEVTPFLEPGKKNLFVVRVYDWVGAGGLNGEVWLTTGPVGEGLDLLNR